MSYSTLNNIQKWNQCYMTGTSCVPPKPRYLPSNNQLNALNADTNNPLNCWTPEMKENFCNGGYPGYSINNKCEFNDCVKREGDSKGSTPYERLESVTSFAYKSQEECQKAKDELGPIGK